MTDVERLIAYAILSMISPILALVGAELIRRWRTRRYANWRVEIEFEGERVERGTQELGGPTVHEWLADPWKCKIGLKSAVSDLGWVVKSNVLACLEIDKPNRIFLLKFKEGDVNRSRNSASGPPAPAAETAANNSPTAASAT